MFYYSASRIIDRDLREWFTTNRRDSHTSRDGENLNICVRGRLFVDASDEIETVLRRTWHSKAGAIGKWRERL